MNIKQKSLTLFFFSCIVLTSCLNSKTNNNSFDIDETKRFKYEFDVKKISDTVDFNSLVEKFKFIQLETNEKCRLDEIEDVLISKGKILIVSNGIYCFDMKGAFLYALNKRGKGPGEYLKLSDVSIDGESLYLYDNLNYKLSKFNIQDGHFIEAITLPYSARQVQVIGNTLFMNKAKIKNDFLQGRYKMMVSSFNDLIDVKGMLKEQRNEYLIEHQLWVTNSNAYWSDAIRNRVYKVTSDQIINYASYNFGKLSFSEKEIETTSLNKLALNRDKIFRLGKVYETKQNIFSETSLGGWPVWTLFRKNTKEMLAYKNVKSNIFEFTPTVQAIDNETCYKIISNLEVNFVRETIKQKGITRKRGDVDYPIYEIMKSSKESDNPVIVAFNFK